VACRLYCSQMSLCSTNMPHRTCRVIHSSPCHITDIEACLEWSLVAYGEETRRPKSRRTVSKATAGGRRQASGLLLTRPPSLVSSKPSESLLWRCVACRNGKQQSCRYLLFFLSTHPNLPRDHDKEALVGGFQTLQSAQPAISLQFSWTHPCKCVQPHIPSSRLLCLVPVSD
jgi:hypothetical protein